MMRIAFLGLGNMGSGMAHCLLRAGLPLKVWNRTAEKCASLSAAGAIACDSAASVIEDADLVISCLMDDASVRQVFGGAEGLIARMPPRAIHLCVTTISPDCADWLASQHAAHGSRYVSGPVVGRPDAAAAGQLVQFLAGDAAAIAAIGTVCRIFAPIQVPMAGDARAANLQKLCVNFFMISLIEVMSECLTFAEKAGASRQIMAHFLDQSFAHPGLKGYARRLAARDSDGGEGFRLSAGLKDVKLILEAARQADCPLDIASCVESKMHECLAQGMEHADWSAIQTVTRLRAGLLP